ncbi:hypothetical protein OHB41_43050 [Streptomyces sp. NBC_01571]|uniref:hypothetical protein n=1 Tax=Streptomyces sp. NBC_01571 TaxID=2975883 RepID=UPI00225711AF|nr:hypothetical protein [Streptomyces sp. NBC_01571]MCX4579837.1 hypothetical protein [Streptomyces sp. NBC_01571]
MVRVVEAIQLLDGEVLHPAGFSVSCVAEWRTTFPPLASDFASRAAKRYRSELRDLTGWYEGTKLDLVKLISHLVGVIWHDERREERVRAERVYPFSFWRAVGARPRCLERRST